MFASLLLGTGKARLFIVQGMGLAGIFGGDGDDSSPLSDFDHQGKVDSGRHVAQLEGSVVFGDGPHQRIAEFFVFALDALGGRFDGRKVVDGDVGHVDHGVRDGKIAVGGGDGSGESCGLAGGTDGLIFAESVAAILGLGAADVGKASPTADLGILTGATIVRDTAAAVGDGAAIYIVVIVTGQGRTGGFDALAEEWSGAAYFAAGAGAAIDGVTAAIGMRTAVAGAVIVAVHRSARQIRTFSALIAGATDLSAVAASTIDESTASVGNDTAFGIGVGTGDGSTSLFYTLAAVISASADLAIGATSAVDRAPASIGDRAAFNALGITTGVGSALGLHTSAPALFGIADLTGGAASAVGGSTAAVGGGAAFHALFLAGDRVRAFWVEIHISIESSAIVGIVTGVVRKVSGVRRFSRIVRFITGVVSSTRIGIPTGIGAVDGIGFTAAIPTFTLLVAGTIIVGRT